MCNSLVDLRWPDKVHCPYNDCSELVVDECKQSNVKRQTKCPICKRLFCYRCRVPWHTGYFCDRHGVRRDKDDVLFDRLALNRSWKRCPKCDRCVELVSGCSYMKCRYVSCFFSLFNETCSI
ncbi:hypothetical protein QJS04_geneDACA020449 [Acorus gramineus]|uniref:RBR-type E3 ubiquitin transferase n=1 Tax=Acorus gramineus TaxID=55184 RepID=A0AAV9BT77_ACOGR|nr:hypothetical protein QJS04_geneDACA020449 [Acorus gramineus]